LAQRIAARQPAAAKEEDFQPPCGSAIVADIAILASIRRVLSKCAALRRHFARWEGAPTRLLTLPQPANPNSRPMVTAAADLAAVPNDRGLFVKLGSHELALFRVGEQIHALDNSCPHAGGSLADGALSDGCVTCPLHNWKFDASTGAASHPRSPVSLPIRQESKMAKSCSTGDGAL